MTFRHDKKRQSDGSFFRHKVNRLYIKNIDGGSSSRRLRPRPLRSSSTSSSRSWGRTA